MLAIKFTNPVFKRSPLLVNSHLETIIPAQYLAKRLLSPPYQRTRWHTPDHDFIDLDWVNLNTVDTDTLSPIWVLFHGLEGNSQSHYAKVLMSLAHQKNITGVVVHFRGCSGEPNLGPRAYHCADSQEIDWILRRLHTQFPHKKIYAAGISLGGNALAKWLGEQGNAAKFISKAAIISAPLDVTQNALTLSKGFNQIYTRHFLKSLHRKSEQIWQRFPNIFDLNQMRQSKNFYEFDNVVTAPLHGFRDAWDYWKKASAKPLLSEITVPTLLLNARNDPFLPESVLPSKEEVSNFVHLLQPQHGGHAGFCSGVFPLKFNWFSQTIEDFFMR